jgi:hypothetical protein
LKHFSRKAAYSRTGTHVHGCGQLDANWHWVVVSLHPLDVNSERSLQLLQLEPLIPRDYRGSNAPSPCATGAADAVDKVFGDFWQIVINHVSDVLHVNPA